MEICVRNRFVRCNGRNGLPAVGGKRSGRGGGCDEALEFDKCDLLRFVVLRDRKVAGGQSFDGSPLLVRDGYRLDDESRLRCGKRVAVPRHERMEQEIRRPAGRRSEMQPVASESHPKARKQFPHRIRPVRQAELRAADDGVQTGIRHAIEHVRRVDPPVHRPPIRKQERARDAGIQRKLPGAGNRISPGIAPLTRCRRRESRRVHIVAGRRGAARKRRCSFREASR